MSWNKNILPYSIKYGSLTCHSTQETNLHNFNHKSYGTSHSSRIHWGNQMNTWGRHPSQLYVLISDCNNMIPGQVCRYKKKANTVTVNSYFLDMFNAQYMFAVCFALLDYSEWKVEKKCFWPVLWLSTGRLTRVLGTHCSGWFQVYFQKSYPNL